MGTDARREYIFAGLTTTFDQRSLLLLRPLVALVGLAVFYCCVRARDELDRLAFASIEHGVPVEFSASHQRIHLVRPNLCKPATTHHELRLRRTDTRRAHTRSALLSLCPLTPAFSPLEATRVYDGRYGPLTMASNSNAGNGSEDGEVFSQIRQALEIVHNPYSANDARRQAQDFLEQIKDTQQAPIHGHSLASDRSQPHIVRHYGLSLLEHAIRYQWSSYEQSQIEALLQWVLGLTQAIARDDPAFIRNKTAQLWIEMAKRSWGQEWSDMDTRLVELWNADSAVYKEFVLLVLETLADEVFTGDDPVVNFREGVLSKACVEIFTPTDVLVEMFPNRQAGPDVRCGHEGWLTRITQFLSMCLAPDAGIKDNAEVKSCAIRCLATMQTQLPWAVPKAITVANSVEVLCTGLACPVPEVQKVKFRLPLVLWIV